MARPTGRRLFGRRCEDFSHGNGLPCQQTTSKTACGVQRRGERGELCRPQPVTPGNSVQPPEPPGSAMCGGGKYPPSPRRKLSLQLCPPTNQGESVSIPCRELSGMPRCRCRHTDGTSLTPGTPKPLFLHKNQHQRPQTPQGEGEEKPSAAPHASSAALPARCRGKSTPKRIFCLRQQK